MKLILPVIILVLIVTAGYFVFHKSSRKSSPQQYGNNTVTASASPNELKTFESKTMKFSIQSPLKFQIKDNVISVDLQTKEGKITIVRNGTNFNNLKDYLNDFDSKRGLRVSDTKNLEIDMHDSVSRLVNPQENTEQKSYYIYVNNLVYIFSTKHPALFFDLDQIAQSFKYTP